MFPCKIPYFADESALPAQLPTVEEIESATEILSQTHGCKVVGINTHFVVKYGPQVELIEGETMLFLAQSSSIPVPRVYALFRHDKQGYIIMERIKGSTLSAEWPKMNETKKKVVSSKLRAILEDMRKLESPGGYCSVGHRGLSDGMFWTDDPARPFAGPFTTESELNDAMVGKYLKYGFSKHKADFYGRAFGDVFQNHPPIFAHGDFQRKNIMIRGIATEEDEKEDEKLSSLELVLIDWEFAGWYPSYWEYARAVACCGLWDDDWSYWVDQILEPFRCEFTWADMIFTELWS